MADKKFAKLFESLETANTHVTPIQQISKSQPKKSDNEKQFLFWLEKNLLKSLKKEAFERECPIKEIICEGIELYFENKKVKR